MRATVRVLALLPFLFCLLSFGAENPGAGIWKLNAAKSSGPVPACLDNGILKIPGGVYTGPANGSAQRGPTLTMTQPQRDRNFKAVFDRP
jgi:hypothetical protein